MADTERAAGQRLNSVFAGFPEHLLAPRDRTALARFALDLDALGRIVVETGEPVLDEQTLGSMLRPSMDPAMAAHLIDVLKRLPSPRLRSAEGAAPPSDEVTWFRLAERVTIFDPTPAASFRDLGLGANQSPVAAVHRRFPSLEDELLVPEVLPRRLLTLLDDDSALAAMCHTLVRQLGWWAVVTALLLVPPAVIATRDADSRAATMWPLAMFLLAVAVGGWTLTVVGSCVLAPTD